MIDMKKLLLVVATATLVTNAAKGSATPQPTTAQPLIITVTDTNNQSGKAPGATTSESSPLRSAIPVGILTGLAAVAVDCWMNREDQYFRLNEETGEFEEVEPESVVTYFKKNLKRELAFFAGAGVLGGLATYYSLNKSKGDTDQKKASGTPANTIQSTLSPTTQQNVNT